MKTITCGILGLGTVGSGVVSVLGDNAKQIERRTGCNIVIKSAFVRNPNKNGRRQLCQKHNIQLHTDPLAIINDPQISIILELVGGTDHARNWVCQAIAAGKHIVTANKALIALHGDEIINAANAHKVQVLFESAVAGGIPIIKAIHEGLAGNKINWLAGIINGTTNFILSKMQHGGDFADTLKEAQDLGYAEADPSFDIDGIDCAHKLTILASLAFGIKLQFDKVATEGIRNISAIDVLCAEQLGYRIKHLGVARQTKNGITVSVHPAFVAKDCLLASVDGVMNAVLVSGDQVGTTMYYGAGAGALPTASAVVADIIDITRKSALPPLAFQPECTDKGVLADEQIARYYLRLTCCDTLATSDILHQHGIQIAETIKLKNNPSSTAIISQNIPAQQMAKAVAKMQTLPQIATLCAIRLEKLE